MQQMSNSSTGMQNAVLALDNTSASTTAGVRAVSEAVELVKARWSGHAADTYVNQAMARWFSDSKVITDKLGEMVALMRHNAKEVVSGEQQNVQVASNLGADVGLLD